MCQYKYVVRNMGIYNSLINMPQGGLEQVLDSLSSRIKSGFIFNTHACVR